MLKQSVLFIAAILSTAIFLTGCSEEKNSSDSSSSSGNLSFKPDYHSSKVALAKGIMKALVEEDADLMWSLLSPATRKDAIDSFDGNEENAKTTFFETLLSKTSETELENIENIMENEESFTQAAEDFIAGAGEHNFTQVNGKWYLGIK